MSANSDWLPLDALTSPAIISAFTSVVSEWSQRWFGDRSFEIQSILPQPGTLSPKEARAEWRSFGHGIFIDLSEDVQLAVAELALHVSKAQYKLTQDDKALMLAFSQRILNELVEQLVNTIGHDSEITQAHISNHPYTNGGGAELQIESVNNNVSLVLGIKSNFLIRLRKRQCVREAPTKTQSTSLIDILGPTVIGYYPTIGRSFMSASEFHSMTESDVVLIDRPLSDSIDIMSESSGRLLFKAMLGQHSGCLALTASEDEGNET